MGRHNIFKMTLLIFLFVLIQTYFQHSKEFSLIVSKWTGYFIPLIWAIFITVLISPVIDYLEKGKKINRKVSIFIVLFMMLLIIVAFFLILIPQIISSVKDLNDIYPYIVKRVTEISQRIIDFLAKKNIVLLGKTRLEENATNLIIKNSKNIQKFTLSVLENMVWWTVGISNFLIGLFLAVLILIDKKLQTSTKNNIITLIFGVKNREYVVKKIKDSNTIFINYIVGKLIVSFFVGMAVFIVLKLTKTPYAALSSILLGLGNMIPYVGSIVGGVIATFLIFIVAPMKLIYLFLAIIISQLLDGFIIGPKIIGDKVGLNTFWVMVSMLIFGGLFGLVGMFLAVPIMCIIKLFYVDLLNLRKNEEN